MMMLKQLFLVVLFSMNKSATVAQIKIINLYPVASSSEKKLSQISLIKKSDHITNESKIDFSFPLINYRVTSEFGIRRHPVTGKTDFHQGVDLIAKDKVIRNMMVGKVIKTGYHHNLGNYVQIDHGSIETVYGHLSAVAVESGQILVTGYPIGIMGSSGRTTGEHLHFAVKYKGIYIDPLQFLRKLNKDEYYINTT